MNKFLLKIGFAYIIVVLIHVESIGQVSDQNYFIGRCYDINGTLLDQSFDMDYSPNEAFLISYDHFLMHVPGIHYYNVEGYEEPMRNQGYIKLSKKVSRFSYKVTKDQFKERTIYAKECAGVILGRDSFAVIQNFELQRKKGPVLVKKKSFASVITNFGDFTYFKSSKSGFDLARPTYLLKQDGSDTYFSFPQSQSEFSKVFLKVCPNFSFLTEQIKSGNWTHSDMERLIQVHKYFYKLKNNEPIYFSSSWDEIDDKAEYAFYAQIESFEDKLWHLKFFLKDRTLIYSGSFSALNLKKQGLFVWYYKNGVKRKECVYNDNSPSGEINTYHENGKPHTHYTEKKGDRIYKKVTGIDGESVLDFDGGGKERISESTTQREIVNVYHKNKLVRSYYVDDSNRSIYLTLERPARLSNFEELKKNLFMAFKYPVDTYEKRRQGLVLVRCVVTMGTASEFKIIKGIDQYTDSLAIAFLSKQGRLKWEPGRIGDKMVQQELIIPFMFLPNLDIENKNVMTTEIRERNSFSGSSNYFYDHNMWFMQWQDQIQQQIINSLPPPTYLPPPPVMRGF